MVHGLLPNGYNKLEVSFADQAPEPRASDDLEDESLEGVDENECVKSKDHEREDTDEILETQEANETDQPESEEKGKKWKISGRLDDGTISYIHIKQAIKLLFPRSTYPDVDKGVTGFQSIYLAKLQSIQNTT